MALEGLARGQALDVDDELEHRAGRARQRPGEGGGEVGGRGHALGVGAVGGGERHEVGVLDVGEADPARVGALLVHADGAVAAVVDDEDDRPGAGLQRAAELRQGHLEVAVAGDADDRALGVGDLRGDGGGHAVAHGARLRREEALALGEGEVLVRPGGEVAGAVGQDGVAGQPRLQVAHDLAHVERARLRRRGEARAPVGVGGGGARRPAVAAGEAERGEGRHQPVGMRVHRQRGGLDLVELGVRGMGVDQRRGHRAGCRRGCSPRSGSRRSGGRRRG